MIDPTEPIVDPTENTVEAAVYDAENPAIQEAIASQERIDAQREQEVVEADPALKTPEGQTSVTNPEGDPEKNKKEGKPLGYTDTRLNQETGKEEKVERSYSDNDFVRSIQQAGDAAMDNPLTGSVAALGAGVVDTATDVMGLIPWLKPIDEMYDENFGRDRSKNALTGAIRDISAIVVPSLAGGAGLWSKAAVGISKLGKVGKAVSAAKHYQTVGRIATDMAVSTTVAGVSEQTSERGNASSAIGGLFGIQVPWDSSKIDDPDVRWQMNMIEEVGLGSFAAVLDGFFSMAGKGAKIVAKKGDKASEAAVLKVEGKYAEGLVKADGDELTAAVEGRRVARETAQNEEAVRRYEQSINLDEGQPAQYDAFINEPAEPAARVVMNYDAEPIDFMVDRARIANPIKGKTVNARSGRPAVTETFKRDLVEANDNGTRERLIGALAEKFAVNFDTMIGTETISNKEIQEAVEEFASMTQNLAPNEYRKAIDELKGQTDKIMNNNVRVLSRDGFNLATAAFRKSFDMLDPKLMRASGVVAGQSGTDISDLSRAINFAGDYVDTTRQQELIWENLKVLLPEIRASQYLDGWRLNADKFAKAVANGDDTSTFAQWMDDTGKGFEVTIKAEKEKALEFINTLEGVSKENPEFFKPLLNEYAKSGDVDTVYKLTKKMEQKIGFWKKAFVDGNPQVPSQLVKQLQAVRYNNILTGLAPVRALGGAATALAGKPLTVLAGSAITADSASFKRSLYAFGGIQENLRRAFQVMRNEWHDAVNNPMGAKGIRQDYRMSQIKEMEEMDDMAAAWYERGELGKVAVWNMTKSLSAFNNNPIVRFGINSMTAIDGFTKSMIASMNARAKAYDTLFRETNGAVTDDAFRKMQREIYADSWDVNGVLKDDAAIYASGEINLNLPNEAVGALENTMKNVPILKSIFMFPRTGVNALSVVATFNPTGALGMAVGKSRKVMKAKTAEQIEEVLVEHGLQGQGIDAFNALKAEYRGRQAMGASVTMGAAMLAFNGGLTGSGPQDAGEKRRMIQMGWKPFSIKNPVTGEWHSYQGVEPFDTYLGLVADIVYQGNRVDQAISEDFLRGVSASIAHNITAKSFLSGFEPLAGMISGDPHSMSRFIAMNADSIIPGTGVRSILNKAISPQLKDVENNWQSYLANRNKWLPIVNENLVDMLDVYTGKPINTGSPWNSWVNSMLPFFKTNEGMEEWRQKLLATGWDGLQVPRTHPQTGEQLKPAERQFINNWIAENEKLGEKIDVLLSQNDNYWMKEIKKYAKARGTSDQSEFPIKETVVHQALNDMHNAAFKRAYAAMNQQNSKYSNIDALQQGRNAAIGRGDYDAAGEIRDKLIQYGKN